MTDVVEVLRDDPNVKVRHAAIDVLGRFATGDDRVIPALRRAADTDGDELVRIAADGAARQEPRAWSRKAVRRRRRRSNNGPTRAAASADVVS